MLVAGIAQRVGVQQRGLRAAVKREGSAYDVVRELMTLSLDVRNVVVEGSQGVQGGVWTFGVEGRHQRRPVAVHVLERLQRAREDAAGNGRARAGCGRGV